MMTHYPFGITPDSTEQSPLSHLMFAPTRVLWNNDGAFRTDTLPGRTELQVPLMADDEACCRLSPGGAVLLDFGRELCGSIRFIVRNVTADTEEHRLCRVRFRFGESCNECMAELGEKGTTNDHCPRDFTAEVRCLNMPVFGPTGFRFVRIDNISETPTTLVLYAVFAEATFRDIEYKGSFRSSDELLNRIYDTASYTVHLCMQDYLWDGIKRDRLVWVGDLYPEIAALCSVFGDNEVVEKSLDHAVAQYPLPMFLNGIITYSAWWVLIQYRWYLQNGHLEYLKAQKGYLVPLMHEFEHYVNADGTFERHDQWAFVDWPSNADEAMQNAGVHALIRAAYEKGAFLLEVLGDETEAAFCRELAARMKQAVYPAFDYKQISAIRVMTGMCDAKEENDRLLSKNGAHGISTFLGLFTFMAESEAGDTKTALENIRGLYGGMLDRGATSFWEDFDPAWGDHAGRIDELTPPGLEDIHGDRGAYCYGGFRHSLCHGWSSGVCAYLAEYVLGVHIDEPGCRAVTIRGRLGGLKEVSGTYPTPCGVLKITHTLEEDGHVRTICDAPEGVRVTVLPAER